MNPQHTVQATGRNLRTWLGVTQVLYVLGPIATALAVFLPSLTGVALPPGMAWAGFAVIMLSGLGVVLTLLLFGWTREWLETVRGWAVDGATPDRVRVSALRTTLERWIVFGQWAPVVVTALWMLLVLVAGTTLAPLLLGSTGAMPEPLAGPAIATTAISALSTGMLFMGFLAMLPYFAVNFLIFRAIRVWMNRVSGHLLGFPQGPLAPAAQAVNQWFVGFQVLLVISALLQVLGLIVGNLTPGSDRLINTVSFLAAIASVALTFLLIDWSRRFATSVADVTDGNASQPAAPYPA